MPEAIATSYAIKQEGDNGGYLLKNTPNKWTGSLTAGDVKLFSSPIDAFYFLNLIKTDHNACVVEIKYHVKKVSMVIS